MYKVQEIKSSKVHHKGSIPETLTELQEQKYLDSVASQPRGSLELGAEWLRGPDVVCPKGFFPLFAPASPAYSAIERRAGSTLGSDFTSAVEKITDLDCSIIDTRPAADFTAT